MTAPGVVYRVRLRPLLHELEVEMAVTLPADFDRTANELVLEVPTWVPGAYGFMKYGRDVFDVSAVNAVGGAALVVERRGWSGFAIGAPPEELRVSYRVYAYDPAWGELTGFVASDHAVLLGTRYLHVPSVGGACRVHYELPEGWAIHHPAGASSVGDNVWEYASYAVLLDTPVVLGQFDVHRRTLHGAHFDHVFIDRAIGHEAEVDRFIDALMKVASACHDIFGSFPFDGYSFVFSCEPTAHWGLEHAHATMIALSEAVFVDAADFQRGIRVAAHELLHAWNVCRLKPAPLGRPDLVRGSFPDALWISEGVTRYYEFLLCVRTGVLSPESFFSNLVNYYRHLTVQPAYERVSALDSSLTTFLNHNRYPGCVNNTIDYYDKGMLVAFDLDASVRPRTSLDREFAAFYDAFVGHNDGFRHADFAAFVDGRAPGSGDLLQREVVKPAGLSTVEQLTRLGFEVVIEEVPYLGIVLVENSGPAIANVLDTSPAASAGLAPGDQLVRMNRFRFFLKGLKWLVASRLPIELEIQRGHRVLTMEVIPETRPDITRLIWAGSPAQAAAWQSWLSRPDFQPAKGAEIPLTAYENFHGIQTVF